MTTIITIHGTNAGAASDVGDQWWQRGSAFQARLQELIKEPIEFLPFHWSGENSESARRAAALKLIDTVNRLEKSGASYSVIGHSHGGSVLAEALRQSVLKRPFLATGVERRRRPLEGLRAWATVGTPFLNYRAVDGVRLNLFSAKPENLIATIFVIWLLLVVFQFFGPAIAYFLIVLVLSAVRPFFDFNLTETMNALASFMGGAGWLLATGGLTFLAGMLYLMGPAIQSTYQLQTLSRSPRGSSSFRTRYEDRAIVLWDRADEAIGALAFARNASLNVTPATIGAGTIATTFALLAAIAVFGFGLFSHYNSLATPLFRMESETARLLARSVYTFQDDLALLTIPRGSGWTYWDIFKGIMFFGGLVIAFEQLFLGAARRISASIARISDAYISRLVRRNAFGADLPQLSEPSVAASPDEFDSNRRHLPDPVSEALRRYSDKYAASFIEKGRRVLGLAQMGFTNDEILREMTQTLTWKELIHTAYFDVDEFVKVLAHALIAKGGVTPSKAFLADPDFAAARHWYEAIAPGPIESAGGHQK